MTHIVRGIFRADGEKRNAYENGRDRIQKMAGV
jgi:hypothetical protein